MSPDISDKDKEEENIAVKKPWQTQIMHILVYNIEGRGVHTAA